MASSSTPLVSVPEQAETVLEAEAPRVQGTMVGADVETLGCLQLTAAEIEAGLVGLESDLA